MFIKLIIFIVIAVVILIALVKNINQLSMRFAHYMADQARKVFGNSMRWDNPWGHFLSKAMIVFFSLMLIILFYIIIFSFEV